MGRRDVGDPRNLPVLIYCPIPALPEEHRRDLGAYHVPEGYAVDGKPLQRKCECCNDCGPRPIIYLCRFRAWRRFPMLTRSPGIEDGC